MLTRVVEEGTGHFAAIPGYEVGGKTGTAQKLDPATHRYSRAPGVLSFAGFVPADDPRLVMLVLLDEPKNEKWGSEAAAPIFSAIAAPVLRYLEVPPRDASPIQIVTGGGAEAQVAARVRLASIATETAAGLMPDLRGSTLRQALAALTPRGVRVEVAGRGRVVQQIPAPGEPLADDAVARLTLSPAIVRVAQRPLEPGREAVQ
jgi:cell division protein FtsI (penicillin-binding protein 3)